MLLLINFTPKNQINLTNIQRLFSKRNQEKKMGDTLKETTSRDDEDGTWNATWLTLQEKQKMIWIGTQMQVLSSTNPQSRKFTTLGQRRMTANSCLSLHRNSQFSTQSHNDPLSLENKIKNHNFSSPSGLPMSLL